MAPQLYQVTTDEIDVPETYKCPVTLDIMREPVKDPSTGHVFEKEAIMAWLNSGNGVCPLTRKCLEPEDLVPVRSLQSEIQQWAKSNGICMDSPKKTKAKSLSEDNEDERNVKVRDDLLDVRSRILLRRQQKINLAHAQIMHSSARTATPVAASVTAASTPAVSEKQVRKVIEEALAIDFDDF